MIVFDTPMVTNSSAGCSEFRNKLLDANQLSGAGQSWRMDKLVASVSYADVFFFRFFFMLMYFLNSGFLKMHLQIRTFSM